MRLARLDKRIVGLFLGLLVVVQVASLAAIGHSIDVNARAGISADLENGERVFRRLLAQNAQNLTEAARLLAADYGFRSAIGSGDRETLVDALRNQSDRIGASVAVFTDAQFQPVASTLSDSGEVLALIRAAAGKPSSSGHAVRANDGAVNVLGRKPFQLVTVPVKAPLPIGWVAMGFPLDRQLLTDMEHMSSLQVTLLERPRNGTWSAPPLGRNNAALAPLLLQLRADLTEQRLVSDQDERIARIVRLAGNEELEVAALLTRSVAEATAPYRKLQSTLLLLTLAGVVVFLIGSVITARSITRPIKALSASAERLGAGDYGTPVQVQASDEVGELAQAFERMRVDLQRRAYWDALTGLPNREQFRDLLRVELARSLKNGAPCSVVMLDLDRFKHVNDVLGHAFGDRILRETGRRLSDVLPRGEATLARLGGDEFVALLPCADASTASSIAQRLLRALEQPLTLDDQTVDVRASLGVATAPQHGTEADNLLVRVEVAMYAAKRRQAGLVVYEARLDGASQESLSLLSDLRTAVDRDELRLHLQPKLSLQTGAVTGAEVLLRWQHPVRGMVPPMRFIPFAEQTGFVRVLTGWVVERCAATWHELRAQGLDMKLAVNLSTRDLIDQELPAKLDQLLSRRAVDPAAFVLEITESAIMDDPQRAMQTLQRLHDMGLKLAIDDFGTGYSSLAYLKRLPVHELKIDKSFVLNMERDRADLKIVRSTIDLAHNLGLSVVAEGVESAGAWQLLRALKCDEAQGFFMSRPMPQVEFAAWASEWTAPGGRLDTRFAELL
jgi:diguanylate cyclase (GGDEF)-like protein